VDAVVVRIRLFVRRFLLENKQSGGEKGRKMAGLNVRSCSRPRSC
jgi:hypothetical protein